MLNLYQTVAVEEAIHTCIYCNRIPLTRVRLKSRPANPQIHPVIFIYSIFSFQDFSGTKPVLYAMMLNSKNINKIQ